MAAREPLRRKPSSPALSRLRHAILHHDDPEPGDITGAVLHDPRAVDQRWVDEHGETVAAALELLPAERPPEVQRCLVALVALLRPLAAPRVVGRLELALLPLGLTAAQLQRQPEDLWAAGFVDLLERFGAAAVQPLAVDWARREQAETCLRENSPLSRLLQIAIPTARPRHEARHFLRTCLRRWESIPEANMALLRAVQRALPEAASLQCAAVLRFAVFRCWVPTCPQFGEALLGLLNRQTPAGWDAAETEEALAALGLAADRLTQPSPRAARSPDAPLIFV